MSDNNKELYEIEIEEAIGVVIITEEEESHLEASSYDELTDEMENYYSSLDEHDFLETQFNKTQRRIFR